MRTFGIIGAGLLITIVGMADSIVSTGTLVGVPANFQSTTGSGTPFWNNNSADGPNLNAGDFLTGNSTMGNTDYLGSGFGSYLSSGGSGAPSFTFLQSGSEVQATLLLSDSFSNYSYAFPGFLGTQIGLYNVANPAQNEVLYAGGSLWNFSAAYGVFNNNVTPQTAITAGTWANYGIYAYSCWFSTYPTPVCNTYYSNAALNSANPDDQHFALFEDPQNPHTFYIGFEDGIYPSVEGSGDYNDVIFKLQTTQTFGSTDVATVTPEPATFSVLGIGLVALGLLRRRVSANTAGTN